MNYKIIAQEGLGAVCARYLSEEIRRFDVRADIEIDSDKSAIQPAGTILIIGTSSFIRSWSKRARNAKWLFAFWLPGSNEGKPLPARNVNPQLRFFLTLPNVVSSSTLKRIKADYVGNPLVDILRKHEYDSDFNEQEDVHVVALLLNANRNKVPFYLNSIRSVAKSLPQIVFVVKCDDTQKVKSDLANISNVRVVHDSKYELLKRANAAIVTDPITTLEVALANCPQLMIAPQANWRWFFESKIPPIVNDIGERSIVKKLSTADAIEKELMKILQEHQYSASILAGYQLVREKIGMEPCFRKTAQLIIETIEG